MEGATYLLQTQTYTVGVLTRDQFQAASQCLGSQARVSKLGILEETRAQESARSASSQRLLVLLWCCIGDWVSLPSLWGPSEPASIPKQGARFHPSSFELVRASFGMVGRRSSDHCPQVEVPSFPPHLGRYRRPS